jgi:hypothetical protein
MVHAFGTPKRHPQSGVFFLRKRVPDRLRKAVGKREIKISLRTRDPDVARIRHLEQLLRIEHCFAQFDGVVVRHDGSPAAYLEIKAGTGPVPPLALPDRPSPHPAAVLETPAPVSLIGLFESYAEEAQLSPATIKRWAPLITRFTVHLGHDDAQAVSRDDVIAWKDSLLKEDIANLTVRDAYLASVRATLEFGVDQGKLVSNSASGVRVRVRKALQEREKGFDAKEAASILSATMRKASSNSAE